MDQPFLTLADGIIIVFTLFSVLLAMARGFTREILGIISLTGSAFLGWLGSNVAGDWLRQVIDLSPLSVLLGLSTQSVANITAGLIIFLVLWVFLAFMTHWCAEAVRQSAIGSIDRILGMVFGAFRSFLLLSLMLLVYMMVMSGEQRPEWMKKSLFIPYVKEGSNILVKLMPEEIQRIYRKPVAPLPSEQEAISDGYQPSRWQTEQDV